MRVLFCVWEVIILKTEMFKFGFSDDEEKTDDLGTKLEWKTCEEVLFVEKFSLIEYIKEENIKTIKLSNLVLKYLTHNAVFDLLSKVDEFKESSLLKAEHKHSDLLPAIYEGGLKVWECSYDLLNYLEDNIHGLERKTCLDLGCGSGVIGIYCLLRGATCTFQDYNIEVIKHLTIPNILLNQNSTVNSKFYAGDWGSFCDLFSKDLEENKKFDYIFTSEIIYNTENYPKILSVFKNFLKKNGTIFLAAKSYYFGVGGGVAAFKKYIDNTRHFKYETIWENSEGVKRTILKINFL